jgi:hypothetical protein
MNSIVNVEERKRIEGGTGQRFCDRSGWMVFEAELAKSSKDRRIYNNLPAKIVPRSSLY